MKLLSTIGWGLVVLAFVCLALTYKITIDMNSVLLERCYRYGEKAACSTKYAPTPGVITAAIFGGVGLGVLWGLRLRHKLPRRREASLLLRGETAPSPPCE